MRFTHRWFFAAAVLLAAATVGAAQAPVTNSDASIAKRDGRGATVNAWLIEARVAAKSKAADKRAPLHVPVPGGRVVTRPSEPGQAPVVHPRTRAAKRPTGAQARWLGRRGYRIARTARR